MRSGEGLACGGTPPKYHRRGPRKAVDTNGEDRQLQQSSTSELATRYVFFTLCHRVAMDRTRSAADPVAKVGPATAVFTRSSSFRTWRLPSDATRTLFWLFFRVRAVLAKEVPHDAGAASTQGPFLQSYLDLDR